MPWLSAHADVNALDLAGAGEYDWPAWQVQASETLKRVSPPVSGVPTSSLERIVAFTELKTVWHTKALR